LVSIRITDGPHETPHFVDDGVPFLSAEAVKNNALDFKKKRGHIKRELHEIYSKKCLPKIDDVFMVKSGNTTGALAIVETEEEFNIWSPLSLIRANREKVLPRFVFYSMQSEFFQTSVQLSWSQGTQPNIGMGVIENLQIATAALSEQSTIINFLDHETAKIDTLIDRQQQLIKLLKEKRQAVISHAVTKGLNPDAPTKDSGVEWLGEVPEHWITPALKYMCSLLKDGTHLPPPRVDDGIPLLSVRNMIGGKFVMRDDDSKISYSDFLKLKQSFEVLEDDVLLAVVGATLGKTAIVEKMDFFHIQRSVAIFRCKAKALSNNFLNLIFQSKQFEELLWSNVGFSAQPGIYLGALADFRMPIPPIKEQKKIEEKVSNDAGAFDKLLSVAHKKIALLQERRTALISAAVTGKIDVRDWQPAQSKPPMEASA
jgi:type I restriction enzyme S subunit